MESELKEEKIVIDSTYILQDSDDNSQESGYDSTGEEYWEENWFETTIDGSRNIYLDIETGDLPIEETLEEEKSIFETLVDKIFVKKKKRF